MLPVSAMCWSLVAVVAEAEVALRHQTLVAVEAALEGIWSSPLFT